MVVLNHRRGSITEAVHLYETDVHRQRPENAQHAMVAVQQRMRRIQVVSTVMNTAMQVPFAAMLYRRADEIRATVRRRPPEQRSWRSATSRRPRPRAPPRDTSGCHNRGALDDVVR